MSFDFPVVAGPAAGAALASEFAPGPFPSVVLDRLLATNGGDRGAHRDEAATWSSAWQWDPETDQVGARRWVWSGSHLVRVPMGHVGENE